MPNFHDYCRMQCTDPAMVQLGQGKSPGGELRICVGLKGDLIDTELPTKRYWISLSDDVACKLHRELSVYLPAWNRYLILFGGLYVDGAVDLVQAQTKARAWALTPAVAQLIEHLVRSSDPNDPVLLAELQSARETHTMLPRIAGMFTVRDTRTGEVTPLFSEEAP